MAIKNPTLRRRTKELSECAEDVRESQLLGYELKDVGNLIVTMTMHMTDLQNKLDSQAEHIKMLNKKLEQTQTDRPKGRWHYSNGKPATIGRSFGVICDQCGTESEYCTNFCGECGADMRETKGANEWTKKK